MTRMADVAVRRGRRGILALVAASTLAIGVGYITGAWTTLMARVFPQEPVAAVVERDPRVIDSTLPYNWERYDYVVAIAPADIPPPPRGFCRERFRWAADLDATDAYRSKLRVYIEGKSNREVIIDGAAVKMTRRPAPRNGTHVACPVAGGLLNPVQLHVNLDRGTARYGRIDEPKRPFGFKVGKGERHAVEIQAYTHRYDVRWWLELNVLDGANRQVLRIDDHGEPFRTTAPPPTTVAWNGTRWRVDRSLRQDDDLP